MSDSLLGCSRWIIQYEPTPRKGAIMATWLITGCSTGLGRALAEEALKAGHSAVLTARDSDSIVDLAEAYPETSLSLPLDVRFADQIHTTVDRANDRMRGVDGLDK